MSLGPPNYNVMNQACKLRLDREPPKVNLSKGCWGL
jgi:hypothetical protein